MSNNTLTAILTSVTATIIAALILAPQSIPLAVVVASASILIIFSIVFRKSNNLDIILLVSFITVFAAGLVISTQITTSNDPLASAATETAQWLDPVHQALTATAYQATIESAAQSTLIASSTKK